MNHYCLVCSDPNRFSTKVHTAQNISSRLSRILCKYDKVEISNEIRREIYAENNNMHITCGVCPKINQHHLRTEEDKIHNNLLQIGVLISNHQLSAADYHDTLRLLAGHYPKMYREIERLYCKQNRTV